MGPTMGVLAGPGRSRQAVAIGAAAAVVLGAGIVTAATRADPAERETRLAAASGVLLRLPGGAVTTGVAGELLPDGTVVSTGAHGTATLATGARRAVLAGAGTVLVSGVHSYSLLGGSLVVDVAGPALAVVAGSVRVDHLAGVVRVDRDYGVRVATYSAPGSHAGVSVPTGATADVGRLRQLEIAAVALPAIVPLHLGDGVDRIADAQLVTLDVTLTRTAAAVDADRADPVVDTAAAGGTDAGTAPGAGTGTPSEVLMPAAIAAAAGVPPASARQLRAEQASWGVVAADLGATTVATRTALARLLTLAQLSLSEAPSLLAAAPAPPAAGRRPTAPGSSSGPGAGASGSGTAVTGAPGTGTAAAGPVGGQPGSEQPAGSPGTDGQRPPSAGVAAPSAPASTPSHPPGRSPSAPASPAPSAPRPSAPRPSASPTPGAVDGLLLAVASVAPPPVGGLLPTAAPSTLLGLPLPGVPATPSAPVRGADGGGSGGGGNTGLLGTVTSIIDDVTCALLCQPSPSPNHR